MQKKKTKCEDAKKQQPERQIWMKYKWKEGLNRNGMENWRMKKKTKQVKMKNHIARTHFNRLLNIK